MAGHFFMTAYLQYNVNLKKLTLLRSQERIVKNQIKVFEQKKNVLDRVSHFLDQAAHLGLTKDQWDPFFVNLENEPLSFSKLQTILTQTANSRQYHFKPDSLMIQMGYLATDHTKEIQTDAISQSLEPADTVTLQNGHSPLDITLSLNGHFIVKRRGPDG
jgi:hypothetical protein